MDSRLATYEHIQTVQAFMVNVVGDLQRRALVHDGSKLVSPEVEVFDGVTDRLRGLTYGSDEYEACRAEMKPALDHHYANNDHHPENAPKAKVTSEILILKADRDIIATSFSEPGLSSAIEAIDEKIASMLSPLRFMNLIQILEMVCDWIAAVARHADGDIRHSIEINQKRFGYSDELKAILHNTVTAIEALEAKSA